MGGYSGESPRLTGTRTQREGRESLPEARLLELYRTKIGDTDVVLDVADGYDRTLVALLIAESALDSGRSVAYLTADIDYALTRATELPGLPPASKLNDGSNPLGEVVAYYNAQALGVTDFSTYFNRNPKIEPAEVVVFDDHNMASELMASLFTLRVDRRSQRPTYDGLCALLLSADHGDHAVVERMSRAGADALLLPEQLDARMWGQIIEDAAKLLTANLHTDQEHFTWPRLQLWLHECRVILGPAGIEIRPPHQLIRTLPGYRQAAQRVYLVPQPAAAETRFGDELELPDLDRLQLSASIRMAVAYLWQNYADGDVTLGRVARKVYMSQYHFSRSFKKQTGWRFIDFITALRLSSARQLLRETDMSITEIARNVGYRELSHFQRTFKKRFGTSASYYRMTTRLRYSCGDQ